MCGVVGVQRLSRKISLNLADVRSRGVGSCRSVERKATSLDLENMNMLLRNMPPKVDAQEVRLP